MVEIERELPGAHQTPEHQGWPLELVAMLGGACGSCAGATSNSAIGCVPRQCPHLFPSFVLCE